MAETRPISSRPSITAFFPCYNDAGTIASVVIAADRFKLRYRFPVTSVLP